ncbi:MAG: hypothetical protein ABIH23_27370 [bacterium]
MSRSRPVLVLILFLCVVAGCGSQEVGEFEIYLLVEEISPYDLLKMNLADLTLQEQPLIAMDDIVSYSKKTHEMAITDEAYKRLCDYRPPLDGTSFVVCVGREPIYTGSSGHMLDGGSPPGVSIPLLYLKNESLSLYFNADLWHENDDPRPNEKILRSLKRAGKLRP